MNDIVLHFLISRPQDTYELEQQEKPRLLLLLLQLQQPRPSPSLCLPGVESLLSLRLSHSCRCFCGVPACRGNEPPHLIVRSTKRENKEVKHRDVSGDSLLRLCVHV